MPTSGGKRRAEKRTFDNARSDRARTDNSKMPRTLLDYGEEDSTPRERFDDWRLNMPHRFWLVQRLDPTTQPGKGWFGNRFELDYMGSSEFEFGASHDSLARIRDNGQFVIQTETITLRGVTKEVHFIGSAGGQNRDDLNRKISDFRVWLEGGLRSKERTNFEELFTGRFGFMEPEWIRTVAWWSFDVDILWTLDQDVAQRLLHGLANPATS